MNNVMVYAIATIAILVIGICKVILLVSFGSIRERENELAQREKILNQTEKWLDDRYEKLERITNREYRY